MFGIPRWNIALVVVLLVAMFGYATYFDTSTPEKTVEKFYDSLGTGKYSQAVEYMSVNWAYSILFPKYNNTPPAQLLEKEKDIKGEIVVAFSKLPAPGEQALEVTTLPKLSKIGQKTALVVYDYNIPGNNGATGKQIALMVKETGKWRLFEISDIPGTELGFLNDINMKEMDQHMEEFFAISK